MFTRCAYLVVSGWVFRVITKEKEKAEIVESKIPDFHSMCFKKCNEFCCIFINAFITVLENEIYSFDVTQLQEDLQNVITFPF